MPNPTNTRGFYLVWNPEGNMPRVRHATAQRAQGEATRLSKLNPNQSFYVLRTTSVARSKTIMQTETAHALTTFEHERAPTPPARYVPPGWNSMETPLFVVYKNLFDVEYKDRAKFFNRRYTEIIWRDVLYWRYSNGTREGT